MRKSEMNATDLATHDAIVSTMLGAGWEPQRDQLAFEKGEWTVYDVDMQRSNGRMRLRVFRDPKSEELGLTLTTLHGQVVGLYLKYGARLQQDLDAIVKMQDAIDERNFKQYVARLVRMGSNVYAGSNDRPRQRLIDSKGLGLAFNDQSLRH